MAKIVKPKESKAQKARTKQEQKLDGGIGKIETAFIRNAMRQLWQRVSKARAIAKSRCALEKGMSKCEVCGDVVGNIKIDHQIAVGDLDGGYLERLWCSSDKLTAMCPKCHDAKTKQERKEAKGKANTDNNVNKAIVGVLSKYKKDFDLWIKDNKSENERYVCISSKKDVCGVRLNRLEYSSRWHSIEDCYELESMCKQYIVEE